MLRKLIMAHAVVRRIRMNANCIKQLFRLKVVVDGGKIKTILKKEKKRVIREKEIRVIDVMGEIDKGKGVEIVSKGKKGILPVKCLNKRNHRRPPWSFKKSNQQQTRYSTRF